MITLIEGIACWMSCLNFRICTRKHNLGALESPSCHKDSITTSKPCSYILYSTLHLLHHTSIFDSQPTLHIYNISQKKSKKKKDRQEKGKQNQLTILKLATNIYIYHFKPPEHACQPRLEEVLFESRCQNS